MLHRLYELSTCLPPKAAWQRLNEGMPELYDRGLAVCFDAQGQWSGVESYNGNQGVVYRSGPPNGTDFTPCCKQAGNTVKRLLEAAKKLATSGLLEAEQQTWLDNSIVSYQQQQTLINQALEQKSTELGIDGKQHRGYVYWARSVNEAVYAWPQAKQFLVQQFSDNLAKAGGQRLGVCLVCGQHTQVYGNAAPVACYNLDKPGSIAGGFNSQLAHRNLPICSECALALSESITFAEQHLQGRMAGQEYLILPYSNHPEVREELAHSLRERPERFVLSRETTDLVSQEGEIWREFQGMGAQLAFYLVFFQSEQAAWRVQAEVQQLLPSRLKQIHAIAQKLANAPDLQQRLNAYTLSEFSAAAGKQSAETLRTWLIALFSEKTLNYDEFLHHLVDTLLNTGRRKPEFLYHTTLKAWAVYRFAAATGMINLPTAKESQMPEALIPNSHYGRYISEHTEFFRCAELVVAFLTGCYAATVTSVQREQRGAEPFSKKFIGRLLNRAALQRLYREGHSKLAQYNSLGLVITGLDPDLAQAWVNCPNQWTISDEEATFAFTLGYSLSYRINKQLYSESTDTVQS